MRCQDHNVRIARIAVKKGWEVAKDGAEEEERYQQRLQRKKQAVGTKGMFYADQFSTDKKPMGRFGMGKSGVMWPVPEVVERGYSGD